MCKTFVYSRKKLISMTDFEKKFQNKIARVKGLKGGHTLGWVKVPFRTQDKLYLDDPITMVKKCGLATACKLNELNVRLIMDLCVQENKNVLQVQLKIPSPPFKAMLDHVTSAEPSNRPNKIYYQKTSNPYESRYGPDWHIELKKSSLLICYACVSDMIEHMASETKRVFIGTTHKNYCLFIILPCH